MARKDDRLISDAIFYLLALAILIYLAIWSLKNIIGLIGLGLSMWSIIKIYFKYRNGMHFNFRNYRLEIIVLILGLILSVGWFNFADNKKVNGAVSKEAVSFFALGKVSEIIMYPRVEGFD